MKKVPLSQGLFALVDDEDFDRVMKHKWYASLESRKTKIYAKRRTKKHEKPRWKTDKIRLGHFIIDKTPGEIRAQYGEDFILDHHNDESLDYQKENLKIITQAQNMAKVEGWKKKPDGLLEVLMSSETTK